MVVSAGSVGVATGCGEERGGGKVDEEAREWDGG